LARIGFEPIILDEQASKGLTVIEKVETHAEVGFAVVLSEKLPQILALCPRKS
jgi:predicted nucleotide-binding protein